MKLSTTTPQTDRFIAEWNNNEDFIIAHTSGSTGKPKEIRLPKSDMLKSAVATCRYFSIDSSSVLVCPLSADYIAGKMMIIRAIVSGAELFMEQPSNRPCATAYPPVDLLPVVPSQAKSLIERCADGLTVKNVIVGGAPVAPELERELAQAPFDAYATYGMTETCSHVAVRKLGNQIYEALPGIGFSTDAGNCLTISAPSFSFRSLQTNDIVDLIDETHFKWLGRRDNVIITGGLKVIPESVEERVRDIIAGREFYFTGREDPKWGQAVIMVVEGTDDSIAPEIIRQMSLRLKKWEMPKEIIFKPEFERTSSGKIIRSAE